MPIWAGSKKRIEWSEAGHEGYSTVGLDQCWVAPSWVVINNTDLCRFRHGAHGRSA